MSATAEDNNQDVITEDSSPDQASDDSQQTKEVLNYSQNCVLYFLFIILVKIYKWGALIEAWYDVFKLYNRVRYH